MPGKGKGWIKMDDLIELEISKTQCIRIYLPCKKEDLDFFDCVTIEYLKEQTEYILYYKDLSGAAIISLKELLEKALNFKLQIEMSIKIKESDTTIVFIQIIFMQIIANSGQPGSN